MAKTQFTTLYSANFPESKHKIPGNMLIEVNNDLKEAYVDDIFTGSTLVNISDEKNNPTFIHSKIKNYNNLSLVKLSNYITIACALKLIHVLDFVGFEIKKISLITAIH